MCSYKSLMLSRITSGLEFAKVKVLELRRLGAARQICGVVLWGRKTSPQGRRASLHDKASISTVHQIRASAPIRAVLDRLVLVIYKRLSGP